MKKRWLVLLFFVVFVVSTVFLAPVNVLLAKALPENAAVQLYGVDGTISKGRFSQLSLNANPLLDDSTWKLKALSLLTLSPAFDLQLTGDINGQGQVSASPSKTIKLKNFVALAEIADLIKLTPVKVLPIKGTAKVDIRELRAKDGMPQFIAGRAEAHNVEWNLGRPPLNLGSVGADISTVDGVIIADILGLDSPVDISGQAKLNPDRSYETDIKLKPRATAPANLISMMSALGRPDKDGYYRIKYRGTLPVAP